MIDYNLIGCAMSKNLILDINIVFLIMDISWSFKRLPLFCPSLIINVAWPSQYLLRDKNISLHSLYYNLPAQGLNFNPVDFKSHTIIISMPTQLKVLYQCHGFLVWDLVTLNERHMINMGILECLL